MISEKKIFELIEEYAKTRTGKEEIAKRKSGRFIAAPAEENSRQPTEEYMLKVGEDMKTILFNHISRFIKSFKIGDIIVESPLQGSNGEYTISIGFDEDAVRRKSLDPEKYPDGLTNIVKLFVTGYSARGTVRGVWEGHGDAVIESLKERRANDFLEQAVAEFNKKYDGNAKAKTKGSYKRKK